MFFGSAVADAGDHRRVVQRIREYDRAGHLARQGRQSRIICDIARGEDQCGFAAMQIGDLELELELEMEMIVARDVAGAARTGTHRPQRLLHRHQHRRVLAHAEIVVRAPDGDLGADPVIESAWKTAAAPLEIGEDAVAALGAQRV